MPFSSRVLIGLNGHEADVQLLRYASMVVRLHSSQLPDGRGAAALGGLCATGNAAPAGDGLLWRSPLVGNEDPEIRFVYLFPGQSDPARTAGPRRAALRAQIQTYFTGLSDPVDVGCDVLRGHVLHRLAAFATDFASDLLLVGDASWPRGRCERLVMEAPCSVWLVPAGWAPVLRRVLVPIDFSERSAACLRTALDLMRQAPHAKCLVLHVYRHDTRLADQALDEACRRTLAERFASFIAGIHSHGIAVRPVFVESHCVAHAIGRAAQRHGADLIVMASRGRSRAAGLVLTSVTAQAIRPCRASFLVLKTAVKPVGLWQALRERLRQTDELHFC